MEGRRRTAAAVKVRVAGSDGGGARDFGGFGLVSDLRRCSGCALGWGSLLPRQGAQSSGRWAFCAGCGFAFSLGREGNRFRGGTGAGSHDVVRESPDPGGGPSSEFLGRRATTGAGQGVSPARPYAIFKIRDLQPRLTLVQTPVGKRPRRTNGRA